MRRIKAIIERKFLIRNILSTKLVNVIVYINGFSTEHFKLLSIDGKPLGRVLKRDLNTYISLNLKSLSPREIREVAFRLELERTVEFIADRRILSKYSLETITDNIRTKKISDKMLYVSRRVLKTLERLKRNSSNLLELEERILRK